MLTIELLGHPDKICGSRYHKKEFKDLYEKILWYDIRRRYTRINGEIIVDAFCDTKTASKRWFKNSAGKIMLC